jgi:hypothetical protein
VYHRPVKRLLALLLGGLGLRALLARRRPVPATDVASPAADLRAKLAETRSAEPEPAEPPDVDSRRAEVHERTRRTIDELRDDG